MLASRTVLVTGAASPFGRELVGALVAADAQVVPIDGRFASRAAADDAFATASASAPLDAVVHTCADATAFTPAMLADTELAEWDARGEALIRDGLFTFQAAHRAFRDRGGRIVVVVPTAGISGADQLVPAITAIEGVRAMAKSAARQWGPLGISVNIVAIPLALVAPDVAERTFFLAPPAIGRPPDLVHDVAATIGLLGGRDAAGVNGATIVVDGGSVMVP